MGYWAAVKSEMPLFLRYWSLTLVEQLDVASQWNAGQPVLRSLQLLSSAGGSVHGARQGVTDRATTPTKQG